MSINVTFPEELLIAAREEKEAFSRKVIIYTLGHLYQEGKRAVFFVDAAHFVMGAFLGFVWCFERLFVKIGRAHV